MEICGGFIDIQNLLQNRVTSITLLSSPLSVIAVATAAAAVNKTIPSPVSPMYIVFGLYSFWVPQIVYNVMSGDRRAYQINYLVTMTATRLFFPLYFFGCPANLLTLNYDVDLPRGAVETCLCLVLWTSFQVLILVLQVSCYGEQNTFRYTCLLYTSPSPRD